MAEIERRASAGALLAGGTSVGRIGDPVPAPSSQFRTVQGGNLFEVAVPQNWQAVSSTNAIKFVPQNGYGDVNGGQTVFTHGVELGVARATSRDLTDATRTLVANFARSNPDLRQTAERGTFGCRSGAASVCRSSILHTLAAPNGSASTRRFSRTAICSMSRPSFRMPRRSSTGRYSIASRDRSGCAM